ncbi:hypothetical protein [Peptacetobacter sp. AB845]|uniref:hypothetical protein n=1 Tax=Peptacetobacter sp. AB845 TaxID=3388429 RepID=UPI0039C90CD1
MKVLTKVRMIIPIVTNWIENNLIVRADIYKKRQLVDSFEVSKITISDILEIAAKGRKGCYIYFETIHDIGLVNGVCAIEYKDLTIMITMQ